jgi:protein involved in polysaccharide export with SLBB domain
VPAAPELAPSIGYPIPIREDGTISLPFVGPIPAAGLTIEDAEKAVINAYRQKQILRPGRSPHHGYAHATTAHSGAGDPR